LIRGYWRNGVREEKWVRVRGQSGLERGLESELESGLERCRREENDLLRELIKHGS
jgi:hypothetical protein